MLGLKVLGRGYTANRLPASSAYLVVSKLELHYRPSLASTYPRLGATCWELECKLRLISPGTGLGAALGESLQCKLRQAAYVEKPSEEARAWQASWVGSHSGNDQDEGTVLVYGRIWCPHMRNWWGGREISRGAMGTASASIPDGSCQPSLSS